MATNEDKQQQFAEQTAVLAGGDASLQADTKGDVTWDCGVCTLINSDADKCCDACGTARPPQPAQEAESFSDSDDEQDITDRAAMWGAAGAGAGVGFVFGGGILAAIGAAGGAYAATQGGKVGDAARTSGRGVVKLQRKAVALNEKHKVTETVQEAASDVVKKTKELNDKHQITARAQTAAVGVVTTAKEINEKHQITSRAWSAVQGGLQKAKEFNEKHQVTSQIAQTAQVAQNRLERALNTRSAAAHSSSAAEVETVASAGPSAVSPPNVMRGVPVSAAAYTAPRAPEDVVKPGEESHV